MPKAVIYNHNLTDNYLFATLAGNFQDGSIPARYTRIGLVVSRSKGGYGSTDQCIVQPRAVVPFRRYAHR